MTPERRQILEQVYRVREGMDPHRNLPFARHTMRIPMKDFQALSRLYPGLNAIDPVEKTAAWEAFEKSPFSDPYKVGKVVKGFTQQGILIK